MLFIGMVTLGSVLLGTAALGCTAAASKNHCLAFVVINRALWFVFSMASFQCQ